MGMNTISHIHVIGIARVEMQVVVKVGNNEEEEEEEEEHSRLMV
jgi:hypothetical protein